MYHSLVYLVLHCQVTGIQEIIIIEVEISCKESRSVASVRNSSLTDMENLISRTGGILHFVSAGQVSWRDTCTHSKLTRVVHMTHEPHHLGPVVTD